MITRSTRHALLLGLAGCLAACGNPTGNPGDADSSAFAIVVSEPVALAGAPGSLTYVSIPAGTLPGGTAVSVANATTGTTQPAPVGKDGSVDPVRLPGREGDEVRVSVVGGVGTGTLALAVVPPRRRPVVIRSEPSRGRTDVPLNASIVIVFSEPVDSITINTTTIRLRRGPTGVGGTVRVRETAQELVEFVPDGLLSPNTEYELLVDMGVRDRGGDSLATPVSISFRTTVAPPPAASPIRFSTVVASGDHTCGLAADSSAWCWGDNLNHQSTQDGAVSLSVPVAAGGALRFGTLVTGTDVTCGTSPVVVCWGRLFRPGNAGSDVFDQPTAVFGSASSLPLAGFGHLCGVASQGVVCAGFYREGETRLFVYGDLTGSIANFPTPNFVRYSGGVGHDCMLDAGGGAFCFGFNGHMQLGRALDPSRDSLTDPEISWTSFPIRVENVPPFVEITAGGRQTCALTAEGQAWCWGDGHEPEAVTGGHRFAAISAGEMHVCAITMEGDAYCWSALNGWGVLGNGTSDASASPVLVTGNHHLLRLTTGHFHTCGMADTGLVYCWGRNDVGQLGDGTRQNRYAPQLVANQTPAAASGRSAR